MTPIPSATCTMSHNSAIGMTRRSKNKRTAIFRPYARTICYRRAMSVSTTLKELSFDSSLELLDDGAALVDLRPTAEYLDVHVPGALALLFEFGPGMAMRARDCIPLDVPLILLEDDTSDLLHAGASLRGKGFAVPGYTSDAVNRWAGIGRPASTEVLEGTRAPAGTILDVADPRARPPEDAMRIPADDLWRRSGEFEQHSRVVIAAGYGVRAALAVGILELAGVDEIVFWRTRPAAAGRV